MEGDQPGYDYSGQYFTELNSKIRDLEGKQRLLKDRILLIGQNMIEMKEKSFQNNLETKKDIEIIKQNLEKIKTFLENLSGEISKFARKEDLEILSKQAKMFRPLKLSKKDLNKKN